MFSEFDKCSLIWWSDSEIHSNLIMAPHSCPVIHDNAQHSNTHPHLYTRSTYTCTFDKYQCISYLAREICTKNRNLDYSKWNGVAVENCKHFISIIPGSKDFWNVNKASAWLLFSFEIPRSHKLDSRFWMMDPPYKVNRITQIHKFVCMCQLFSSQQIIWSVSGEKWLLPSGCIFFSALFRSFVPNTTSLTKPQLNQCRIVWPEIILKTSNHIQLNIAKRISQHNRTQIHIQCEYLPKCLGNICDVWRKWALNRFSPKSNVYKTGSNQQTRRVT